MAQTIIQLPAANCSINSDMPDRNFSDYYALFLGRFQGQAVYRSLFLFEVPILPSGNIAKVELVLYIMRNDSSDCPKKFSIHRLTESFEQKTVSYDNQPIFDERPYAILTIRDEINTFIRIDITKLYNGWRQGQFPNCGVMLKSSDESRDSLVAFYSKEFENMIFAPRLEVKLRKSLAIEDETRTSNGYSIGNPSEIYFFMGNEYFTDDDLNKALKYYKKAYECFDPGAQYGPKLVLMLVKVLNELDLVEEGLEVISCGLEFYPEFTDLEYIRSELLLSQGKISLAVKGFEKCLAMGDPPSNQRFIPGSGSYRAHYALSELYFELEDYDRAYRYCMEALRLNPDFTEALYKIVPILLEMHNGIGYIKSSVESFFRGSINRSSLMTIADIFIMSRKYDIALEYLLRAEKTDRDSADILYRKGMCLLYLKEFDMAVECFDSVKPGEFYEMARFRIALCEALKGNMYKASQLLEKTNEYKDDDTRAVYKTFVEILEGKKCEPINSNREESGRFVNIIFDLLSIVLTAGPPETFEKSLQLLNLIENDEVLLRLAKLYYSNGYYSLAYQEFMRSIKMFGKIDREGIKMLNRIVSKSSPKHITKEICP